MSYLALNPEFKRIENQLREMDRQRDHLRAQMADVALRAELEEVSKNTSTFWLHPSVREARMATLTEKLRKREARRANEMRLFGHYVRPGTWDADLDDYQEPKYEEEVSEDYKIRLVRARDLTWNAYVILPAGHCAIGKHYDFFAQEAPEGLPRSPVYLTYGGKDRNGWDEAEVGLYGFYLTGIVKPREDYATYREHDHFSVEETGATYLDDGSKHYSYGKMRAICLELVEYFKGLAADPKTAALCRDAQHCEQHYHYYVGKCAGCSPAEEEKPAEVQYFTSTRAPRHGVVKQNGGRTMAATGLTTETAPTPADVDFFAPAKPKKSWAAVAAGK